MAELPPVGDEDYLTDLYALKEQLRRPEGLSPKVATLLKQLGGGSLRFTPYGKNNNVSEPMDQDYDDIPDPVPGDKQ